MSEVNVFNCISHQAKQFRCLTGSMIIIEGIIGAGKTTASKSIYHFLKKNNFKVKLFTEYVNEQLLNQYINNMPKYSYTFQIVMAMKRLEIHKLACEYSKTGGISIIDRSIPGDYAFALMQKKNKNISEEEWEIYKNLIKEKAEEPSIIINFEVKPEVAFERMKKRGKQNETDGYTLEYFKDLKNNYEKVFKKIKTPILNLNWEKELKLNSDGCIEDAVCIEILSGFRNKLL